MIMIWKNGGNQRLIQAILTLRTKDEAERFLSDLMTEKETIDFAKRLQVAEMLADEISYSIIEQKTGLSSTTVARVAKCAKGKDSGYKTIINRLHHHKPIQSRRGLS